MWASWISRPLRSAWADSFGPQWVAWDSVALQAVTHDHLVVVFAHVGTAINRIARYLTIFPKLVAIRTSMNSSAAFVFPRKWC